MDKFRVLIVDDEDDFRETLSLRLRNRKFIVDVAQSGEKALELLSNQDFDVIILDVLMPGMDGLACLKEIKKMKPLVEVILLTGREEVESGIEGMRMGAFEYLEKPLPLDELLEKMELAYERKIMHLKLG
jgi:two-component system, OmpR family, response regulator